MTTFQQAGYSEERVIPVQADDATPKDDPKDAPKRVGAATRAGQFLTFRLDLELRQRLRARLAGGGRALCASVVPGLRVYIQHGASAAAPDKTAAALTPEHAPGPPTTAVASVADLVLPEKTAV